MSLQSLERALWQKAKQVFRNPKLRLKDILEWSSSQVAVEGNLRDGEVMAKVSDGFWVAIAKKHDKRSATTPG